jgi:hypothetical protein
MDKDYAGLVDEALFECDLDLEFTAKVVDVNVSNTGVLCTIQCATVPNDAQLKLFLDEIRTEIGNDCDILAVKINSARFSIEIKKKIN